MLLHQPPTKPHDCAGSRVVAKIMNVDINPLGHPELDLIFRESLGLVGAREGRLAADLPT